MTQHWLAVFCMKMHSGQLGWANQPIKSDGPLVTVKQVSIIETLMADKHDTVRSASLINLIPLAADE